MADAGNGGAGGDTSAPDPGAGGDAGADASAPGGAAGAASDRDAGSEPGTSPGRDPFGILALYPSAESGASWSSAHWASGTAYGIDARTDPNDPARLSGKRGTGTLSITGDGELVMSGSEPRIYIQPVVESGWRNVEITVYYQRVDDEGTAWAGLVIGTRSGPEGHGNDPCDAHTYYSRLRHDGAVDFEKELMHPPSATRSRVAPAQVWPPDGALPFGSWIGWKFVIADSSDGNVKLEAYRDLSGGADGGSWELINASQDDGSWSVETSCEAHAPVDGRSNLVVRQGGVTFIRNTNVGEARYKWFSVREIQP